MVSNIAMLKVKNVPTEQLNVDIKKSQGNDHNDRDDNVAVIDDQTLTTSPDSCEYNQIMSQDPDESDNSMSDDKSKEGTVKQKSQPSSYIAPDEDMKIIAAACYKRVMEMLENGEVLPSEDDNKQYEEDKIMHHLDVDPLTEVYKASGISSADTKHLNNNEDMQRVAMACYEAVMDMLRHCDSSSVDDVDHNSNHNMNIDYLEVEPSIDKLPASTYSPSVSTNDIQQHCHHEKKTSPEVLPHTCKTVSLQTHSQPLETTSHCCVNLGSVDSLVPCSDQTDSSHQVEPNLEVAHNGNVLKVDGYSSKKSTSEEMSSDELCKLLKYVLF